MTAESPKSNAVPRLLAGGAIVVAGVLVWQAYAPGYFARPSQPIANLPRVDLNKADRAELLQIPGVGPNMADAILSHRTLYGRFESLDELDTLPGIGPKTLDKLRPYLAIGPGSSRTLIEPVEKLERKPASPKPAGGLINVNTASVETLATLPGIGPKIAERIIAERAKSKFVTVEDLDRVPGIGPKTIEKLRPLISF